MMTAGAFKVQAISKHFQYKSIITVPQCREKNKSLLSGIRITERFFLLHGQLDYIRLSGYILVMEQTIRLCKALTGPIRLRILALLDGGELCVCDLVEVLAIPQSTVSRHLAVLKNAGWVCERRQGVWMYYRLAQASTPLQDALRQTILAHLAGLAGVRHDRERLARYQHEKGKNSCG
jgi:ArsR family transcriptional regulator, arsenate/arsenite/antimonite-responsive transcriptional repressor